MTEPPKFLDHFAQVRLADEGAAPYPLEPRVSTLPSFNNGSGVIWNIFQGQAASVSYLQSFAGSVRANHYHLTDWHYSFVVSGRLDYYHRPAGSSEPLQLRHFGPGDLFFSPPMVEHAMGFNDFTELITVSRRLRDHDSHEEDVRRVPLVRRAASLDIRFETCPGVEVAP